MQKNFDFSELTSIERLMLAQALWDSVPAEVEAQAAPLTEEQIAEVRRRISAADAGQMARESWDKIKPRILKNL